MISEADDIPIVLPLWSRTPRDVRRDTTLCVRDRQFVDARGGPLDLLWGLMLGFVVPFCPLLSTFVPFCWLVVGLCLALGGGRRDTSCVTEAPVHDTGNGV